MSELLTDAKYWEANRYIEDAQEAASDVHALMTKAQILARALRSRHDELIDTTCETRKLILTRDFLEERDGS